MRGPDWDREEFEREHSTVLEFLAERCDRVLTATLPLDLGRPRAAAEGRKPMRRSSVGTNRRGAALDLRGFRGAPC